VKANVGDLIMAVQHPADASHPPDAGPDRAASRPHPLSSREVLSELIDGESAPAAAEEACRRWREDESLRADWHAYHLIGDVLRSDDMAAAATRDATFLNGLRQRLKDEPVPMAPAPLASRAPGAWRWMTPAVAIAGFVVVGVAMMVLRDGGSSVGAGTKDWATPVAVTAPPASSGARPITTVTYPAPAPAVITDEQVIRDARLDFYFEAHRGLIGALPMAMPDAGTPTRGETQAPRQ
jgi:sigma-E factor negative regulatory protein RseA